MNKKFSCFVIGEDSLLIKCSEILLEKNQDIYGIVASNPAIVNWAKEHNIPIYQLNDALVKTLKEKPYDYLFSITNLKILSDEIINSPQRSAINFHDGPLPKYAGINATTWALINNEKQYGITWHEITNQVDKGDMLKQVLFGIDPNETALSLNAKCFEAASSAFAELVDELAEQRVNPVKQNFTGRSYFGKFKRPENGVLINWNNSAENISAFVRALNFGRYTNPVGLPKVKVEYEYFIIPNLTITNSKSKIKPGTISSISESEIKVATKTNDISFSEALSIDGIPLSVKQLIKLFKLKTGFVFNDIDESILNEINNFNELIVKKENYWIKKLQSLEFLDVHYAERNNAASVIPNYVEEVLELPKELISKLEDKNPNYLASLFTLFIGRHWGKNNFTLGYSNSELLDIRNKTGGLFSEFVPLSISFQLGYKINEAAEQLTAEFSKTAEAKTYIRDVLPRYPALHPLIEQGGQPVYPVSVVVVKNKDEYQIQQDSLISFVVAGDLNSCTMVYDSFSIKDENIKLLKAQFNAFLQEAAAKDDIELSKISIVSEKEKELLLNLWNNTKTEFASDACIHTLFEQQVEKTPDAVAVVCRDKSLSYKQLNEHANKLAHKLIKLKVTPETLVGVSLHRSVDMMVAIMGVLKAGGAYVPLDPDFPKDRIEYMISDARCPVIITEEKIKDDLIAPDAKIIVIDTDWDKIEKEKSTNPAGNVKAENLSYVIYTSGSTGKPKGVMVQHRNVVNFFKGMDEHISFDPPGVWLAVTSLSFDISVLELFWTLSHGFKVVLYAEEDWKSEQIKSSAKKKTKKVDFSLFYFSSYEGENATDKYRLLIEGAKFADQNRFAAVWTPERHFHDFGGLYPNPAVTGAGIATVTNHVRIMSGSCVSPLHSPIRIAEEWSVVDNLSNGRVGLSIAAGWQPNDFVIKPENYEDRKNIMFEQIEIVRKLWKGESVKFKAPNGKMIDIKTLPRPIQKSLPVWITAANNPETFKMAGERGFNLLTHLLGQTVDDVAEKIALYREAWKSAGHQGEGYVSLMLHTFVGENLDEVRETVREPMKHYLKSAVSLVKLASWYFPTYDKLDNDFDQAVSQLSDEDMDAILNHSFERYFETSALLGTPETCLEMVEKLKNAGVDDVACLIDFGVDSEDALSHLQYLNAVKTLANIGVRETHQVEVSEDYSIPELIKEHKVTHMQCTPSMAKMLLLTDDAKSAIKDLNYLMIGGEAFPVSLAKELKELISGKLLNMYGPTETTIWSSTFKIDDVQNSVPIGRPISNTEIYILDSRQQLVPVGVPGELCIGGEGVVRGYFERPELTDEKFIAHPFNNDNRKIYRTGDLARYRSDGTIEFIGRLDHQVKVRGYRIELGEIEAALEKHPLINEAVVIAREDTPGDKRLAAYLIGKSVSTPSVQDLRDHLKEILPEYMIPAAYIFMDEFPLTPNRKVDRKSLPAPEAERTDIGSDFVEPRTETEKAVAKLWSEVLNINRIGVYDNFFDLGGHSLSAVQVTVKIHQAYNVELSLQNFFQASTLAELSTKIEELLLEQTGGDELDKLLNEVEQTSVKR